MAVDRADWEQDVVTAVTERIRSSSPLLESTGIEVTRLTWSGTDPATSLEVELRHRGRTYRRMWRVWGELSGETQPVPHPTAVAGQVLVDILTTPKEPALGRESGSAPTGTPLPLIGRHGQVTG